MKKKLSLKKIDVSQLNAIKGGYLEDVTGTTSQGFLCTETSHSFCPNPYETMDCNLTEPPYSFGIC